MAAEQNEKAYQKQLGVNVGCVSQPRLNPRASPARTSPCFFPPHRERQALTPSRLSSLPTASAPRARRRVPARTVPATTRTSVLASRPRVRLSRVSRPHRDRQARFGVALDFQGSLGVRGCSQVFGEPSRGSGAGAGTNVDAFRVRITSYTAFGPSPSLPTRSAGDRTAARAAMGTLPASPSRPPERPAKDNDISPRDSPYDCPMNETLTSRPSLPFTTGTYVDKKCPFTGNVSIRGRILTGVVKTHKMNRTLIMKMDYLHYIKKYQRYEKRHTNLPAHISPCFRVKEGDTVIVGQCRPLSKTVPLQHPQGHSFRFQERASPSPRTKWSFGGSSATCRGWGFLCGRSRRRVDRVSVALV